MIKSLQKSACILFILLFGGKTYAQMSGVYSIPGDFATIAAAISSLNAVGVSGPVTINVPAGFTETITGPYSLTATGTSANPIIFQKSGSGANPLITAHTTGTATPGTAIQDGMWALIGSDYITIDGIDLLDPNTANPATMEYGYGLFRASAADGCQNNTIKNCVITLNRVNNASGTNPAVDGSRGINSVSSLITTQTSVLTPTAAAGTNSGNRFYSNTIQNCNIGIALIGYAASSPFTLADTGNDVGGTSPSTGNQIINYGGGGTTNAAAAIRTLAQYGFNASYNRINNNNGSGVNHATTLRGIFINTATSPNVVISSNTITLIGGGTSSQVSPIENASGSTAATNTISIINNLITNCTYTSATSGVFYGIYNSGLATVLNINNNTFLNNTSAATSGSYYTIYSLGAPTGSVNINNNLINNAVLTTTSSSASFRAIVNTGAGSSSMLSINNNSIQAVTTGTTGDFYFINNSAASGTVIIANNTAININIATAGSAYFIHNNSTTVNSTITNNSITGSFTKSTAGNNFYGYYNLASPGSGTAIFSGNNLSNVVLTGATTFYGYYSLTTTSQTITVNSNTYNNISTGAAAIYGVYFSYGNSNNSISSNLISNLSGGAAVYGIYVGSTASTLLNVSSNTISTLSSSGANPVVGYYQTSGTTTNIYKNKIFDLSGSNAGSTVAGIIITLGTTNNTYNNLIGDIRGAIAVGTNALNGISLTGGTTHNIYFNTVNLSASSTGTLFGTSAMAENGSPTTINLRNNIFVNTSVATGTGVTTAYRRASTSLVNYATTSNNNLLYGGTPGASNLLFYDGTNAVQTLPAFKVLMATRDGLSVTENVAFASTTGSNANFLNINTAIPTQVESGAMPIASVTDDYIGTLRNTSNPDIGAWEGNYIINDITPPLASGASFSVGGCSLSSAIYTINLSDFSGIATGALAPRLYFRVNAGSYNSVQGTLASGTTTNGVWSFNPTFSAVSGDMISYYVVAQDAVASPNLMSSPAAGFAGTNVNTITSPPSVPDFYVIGGTLNGTYNVGAGQTYTSLTQASRVYNAACLTGPVTFSLTDALYSSSEIFPVTFLNNVTASATNSLLIKPATGINAVITGTSASAMLRINGGDYIKIDGSNNGTTSQNLTVENTNAVSSAAVIWIGNASVTDAASNITINNAIITGSTGITSVGGIIVSSGISLGGAAEISNNNLTITGNTFLKTQNGIFAIGNAATLDANWRVANNTFGSTVLASMLGYRGVAIQNAQNFAILTNTVVGITNSNGVSVGVLAGAALGNGTVSANIVNGMKNTSASTGYGVYGIQLSASTTTASIMVTNNMISDLAGYGSSTAANNAHGIYVISGAGYKVYHNSVLMNTNQTSTSGIPAAILVSSTVTTVGALDLRNNIFANTQTVGNGYSIYSLAANTVFSPIDYNNYTTASTNLAYITSARANLTALQTGFGGNVNSRTVTPVFVSASDLHLVPASNGPLDNLGTPVGVTIDIDNQSRSLSTPDMGADEFDGPPCTTANGGTLATTSYAVCNGQQIVLSSANTSTGATTSFQWQISTVSGGSYTNVATGLGAAAVSYTNSTLPAGTYYLVLKATCAAASLSGISNEATVTINPVPSPTASASSTLLCSGDNLNLTASTNVGTNFLWSGPNSFTSNVQNPSIAGASVLASGSYTLIVSTSNCTATPVTINAIVSAPPTAVTVTPASASLCAGSAQTLTATGGIVPTTFNFGTQANQNTGAVNATDYPAPYSMYYGGQRMQMLILASELNAAGFNAGSQFSSLQFPVVSRGANWPGTSLPSFQVNIGATSITSITAFQSGLVNVQAPASFTPLVGYNNMHNFSSAFTWDGTSNIIIETTFSSGVNGVAADLVTQYNSPTTFQSTIVYRVDSQTAATVASATGVTYSYSKRPDFKLNGIAMANYVWSPATGLSATTGSTVVATPTTNATYTVSSVNGGCSSSTTTTLVVTPMPTVNIAATSASICTGNSATLTASGANTYSWSTTSTNTSVVVSPATATTYSVTGFNGSCTGTKTISVGINITPTVAIASTSLTLCNGQSATLTASGADTYSWSNGSTATSVVVSPTATTVYSLSGLSAAACSSGIQTVTITVNPLPVVAATSQTICAGGTATLTASGASTYLWSDGSTASQLITSPATNTVYSVTGNSLGCTNSATAGVVVSSSLSINVTAVNPTICIGGSSTLTASGVSTFNWDSGANTSTIVVNPTSTTVYSLTGSNGVCSGAGYYTVTVGAAPAITITASPSNTLCLGGSASLTAMSSYPSYTWSSGSTASVISVTPTANTTYTINGQNTNGCNNSQTITVTTNSLPVISVAPASPTVCLTTAVIFTASGASTYTWSNGPTIANMTVTPTGNAVYTVTGTSSGGCTSTKTVAVTTNTLPVLTTSQSASTVCAGTAVTFTAAGASTYSWNTGATIATMTASPMANAVYTVTGTNAANCSSSATMAVTVNTVPVVAVAQSATIVCNASPVTFTASGASTYTWVSGPTTAIATFSPTGATNVYTVNAKATNGCAASGTVGVNTNTLPVVTIAQTSTAVCIPGSATLTASGASTYTWNVTGNPVTSTLSVAPTANTVYTVTGASTAGCISTKTAAVVSNTVPVITIAQSATAVCLTSAAIFTASGASTYTWNVTGNPTTNTLSIVPTANTVYTVTGASSAGCISTKTVGVNTNTVPVVTASPATSTVCSQTAVSFTAAGANTYSWSNTSAVASITVFPASSTVYTVTGTNNLGCSATATVAVTTMSLPAILVTPALSTVCPSVPYTYTATGATTYTWDNSASTGSTAAISSTAPAASYTVTGMGANGCFSRGQFVIITSTVPVISISASSPTVCSLAAVDFTASGADTYTWSNNATGNTVTVTPSGNTTYTVTGTSALTGCSSTETISVITSPLPAIGIAASANTVCVRSNVTLNASGGDTYVWSHNSSINPTVVVTPTANTTYTLTGTDLSGCTNVATITIATNPLPVIVPGPAASTTICETEGVNLSVTGAVTYTWMPGNTNGAALTVTPAVSTTYTIIGVDANSCRNTGTLSVKLDPCTAIKTNATASNAVSVFPNPTTGVFIAKFEFEGDKTITISNAIGQEINRVVTANTSESFDLTGFAKGVYFVTVSSKQASGNYKIIVE